MWCFLITVSVRFFLLLGTDGTDTQHIMIDVRSKLCVKTVLTVVYNAKDVHYTSLVVYVSTLSVCANRSFTFSVVAVM